MAVLDEEIDLDTQERSRGFFNLDPGNYLAEITMNEARSNENGVKMLVLLWRCVEGENEGGTIFQQIVYINPNSAENERIGKGNIASICDAVGHTGRLEDADVLMNIPCMISVGMSKPNKGYPAMPDVKSVRPANVAPPSKQRQAPTQQEANKAYQAMRETGQNAIAVGKPRQLAQTTKVTTKANGPANGSSPWRNKPAQQQVEDEEVPF